MAEFVLRERTWTMIVCMVGGGGVVGGSGGLSVATNIVMNACACPLEFMPLHTYVPDAAGVTTRNVSTPLLTRTLGGG